MKHSAIIGKVRNNFLITFFVITSSLTLLLKEKGTALHFTELNKSIIQFSESVKLHFTSLRKSSIVPFSFRRRVRDEVTIPKSSKYVTTDKLNQIYLVTPNDELIKYSAEGQELFHFHDRTLGEITYIDATNPFQILVFFEDFQTIVWLDRTLNPISTINLSHFEFFQINTLAVSSDNHLWIYDNTTFQLKKINNQGQVLIESNELNALIDDLNPNFLIEKNNRIYLNNPETGILVFDNFGQFLQIIAITNLSNFQIINNQLFYQKERTFHTFHFQTLDKKRLNLPFEIGKNEIVFTQKNYWFLVRENEVVIFDKL
ncbi:MAG: hypothetical protein ACJAUH_001289 [Saprospiraceae bacterium]|jgi:hypothetical protein